MCPSEMSAGCARSMPRVPRSSLVRLAATPETVGSAAVERLRATLAGSGEYEVAPPPDHQPAIALRLALTGVEGRTDVSVTSSGVIDIPFFGWFFRPLVLVAQRRARGHA